MPSTPPPKHLTFIDGLWCHLAEGPVTLTEGVERVTESIAYCRANGIPRLLIDVRAAHGYTPPTMADRYFLAEDWARAGGDKVRVAIVAPSELIHPGKFGMRVANEMGAVADIFTDEGVARKWLLSEAPPT